MSEKKLSYQQDTWTHQQLRRFTIKTLPTILGIVAILIGFVLLNNTTRASERASSSQCFIDLDGDGFADNSADRNNDGIPDQTAADSIKTVPDSTLSNFFAVSSDLMPKTAIFLHRSEAFTYLKTIATPLLGHRGGFGNSSGFGPGSGIGSGAVVGGACQGGVCRPN